MRKILEFNTQDQATTALAHVDAFFFNDMEARGFDMDGGVVSKNSATGKNTNHRTTTWARIEESVDNTFYFTSPSDREEYRDWRDSLPSGAQMPDDKDCPLEW